MASKKIISVKAKPNSRESSLVEGEGGEWIARLKSPPVDGKANRELIGLVAQHWGVRKSQVRVKTGGSGRRKLVQISE